MQAKWILAATAVFFAAPIAYAAPDEGGSGVAAVGTFGANGTIFEEFPGWDCVFTQSSPSRIGMECIPEPLLQDPSHSPFACKGASVSIGAALSIGGFSATVTCGSGTASCENTTIGFGGCHATLEGRWGSRSLVCSADFAGASTGYVICANGL